MPSAVATVCEVGFTFIIILLAVSLGSIVKIAFPVGFIFSSVAPSPPSDVPSSSPGISCGSTSPVEVPGSVPGVNVSSDDVGFVGSKSLTFSILVPENAPNSWPFSPNLVILHSTSLSLFSSFRWSPDTSTKYSLVLPVINSFGPSIAIFVIVLCFILTSKIAFSWTFSTSVEVAFAITWILSAFSSTPTFNVAFPIGVVILSFWNSMFWSSAWPSVWPSVWVPVWVSVWTSSTGCSFVESKSDTGTSFVFSLKSTSWPFLSSPT